jgi:hypothetical protein
MPDGDLKVAPNVRYTREFASHSGPLSPRRRREGEKICRFSFPLVGQGVRMGAVFEPQMSGL